MVLQTFLLLDLCSNDNGLGGVTLISIKSAPKIYYTRGPWTATLALIKVDEIGQN